MVVKAAKLLKDKSEGKETGYFKKIGGVWGRPETPTRQTAPTAGLVGYPIRLLSDSITPVLAVPEKPVPDGARAG